MEGVGPLRAAGLHACKSGAGRGDGIQAKPDERLGAREVVTRVRHLLKRQLQQEAMQH